MAMNEKVKRKVVMITGAGAGVGRAAVRIFAKNGYDVGLIARDEARLAAAADEVRGLGGRAAVYPLDVADANAIEAAANGIERDLGELDVWVNDAMVSVFSPALDMVPDEFKRVTEVTFLGYVYGTLAALKRMVPRNHGVVIQVGSALAYRGIPLQSAYCAAKHAIQGFTESVRCELIHDGSKVKLVMVQLPAVNTPQFQWSRSRMPRRAQPVPPIYQPEVPAQAILWAAQHPARREVYVGAMTDIVIDGNKLAPGLGDRYLARTGFDSQMTSDSEASDRPDNLYAPVPGDFAAHGRFDDRAHAFSPQLWFTTHRWQALAAGAALLGAGLALSGARWKTSTL